MCIIRYWNSQATINYVKGEPIKMINIGHFTTKQFECINVTEMAEVVFFSLIYYICAGGL